MLTKSAKQRHFSSQTLELTNTSLDCSTFLSQKKNASISLQTNTFSPTSKPDNFRRKSKENPSFLKLDYKSLPTLSFQDLQPTLQVLVLNDCKLRELPIDFSNFSNLKELSLDFNYLTKIPVALPEKVALETFSIKRNLLEILPENYSKWTVSLSNLDVSFNQIDRLEDSLASLKSLRRLMLNNNYFIKIPASLFEMSPSLEEFGLDWFKYTFPPLPFIISGDILRNFMRFCEFLASNSKVFFTFLDLIQNFSSKPLDFTKLFSKKRTLIHKSAFENDIGVLRSLIVLLPNLLNELDSENYSALFLSILEENYNATKILLYSGADPHVGIGMLGGCLHLAVVKKEVFLLQDLLRKGAAPNSVDQLGNSPLHLLFSTFSNNVQKAEKMAKILMEFNSDPHLQNKELWNPLHLAVKCEQLEAVRWVLQYNRGEKTDVFDLNSPGGEVSMTLLHLAGHQGNREIFKLLLESGCDYLKSDALNRLPKNLCVSDQFLLKLIKSREKRDIFKAIQIKKPSNIKKKLTINIEESDNTDEIPHKITLPSTLSPCNTVLFSNKSKYFSNQNKVNPRIFEENDRNNDENFNGDLDESIDNKRHKTIRVILKSPNNIEKIEQYQNVRMSYFRRSMGNSLGISNKSYKNQSFLDGSISLKSFSFQNLENMIENLNYNNEKLRHELLKFSEVNREIDDIFLNLNALLNLQMKEMALLRNLGSEINLLENLFKEDYKKWGENWKEFEKIKGLLNKKGLVHIECNNFLLNLLFSRLINKGKSNDDKNKTSNLWVCMLILRQVVGFVGVSGFKHAFKGFLNRIELKAGKFNNQVLVYEIFNILNF